MKEKESKKETEKKRMGRIPCFEFNVFSLFLLFLLQFVICREKYRRRKEYGEQKKRKERKKKKGKGKKKKEKRKQKKEKEERKRTTILRLNILTQ